MRSAIAAGCLQRRQPGSSITAGSLAQLANEARVSPPPPAEAGAARARVAAGQLRPRAPRPAGWLTLVGDGGPAPASSHATAAAPLTHRGPAQLPQRGRSAPLPVAPAARSAPRAATYGRTRPGRRPRVGPGNTATDRAALAAGLRAQGPRPSTICRARSGRERPRGPRHQAVPTCHAGASPMPVLPRPAAAAPATAPPSPGNGIVFTLAQFAARRRQRRHTRARRPGLPPPGCPASGRARRPPRRRLADAGARLSRPATRGAGRPAACSHSCPPRGVTSPPPAPAGTQPAPAPRAATGLHRGGFTHTPLLVARCEQAGARGLKRGCSASTFPDERHSGQLYPSGDRQRRPSRSSAISHLRP